MCNTLAEGGKRCAVHMRGSRASIKEAEVYTRQDKGLLSKMFTALRKEGKNLSAPSPEEVRDFADGQRVRARFDKELGNRDRNTLIRNWSAARDENPDGGTFHAWKNLRSEATRRARRGIATISIIGTTAITGACGSQPPSVEETPAPSPTATEQETEPTVALPDSISYELPEGFTTGESISTSHGDYIPIQLGEDSPLRTYNPDIANADAKANYSSEDIEEAQNVASEFVINEGIDSPLVYDYSVEASNEWWNNNSDYFHPYNTQTFHDGIVNVSERSPLIDTNSGQAVMEGDEVISGTWMRGEPVLNGEVRTGNLSAELTSIEGYNNSEHLTFSYDVSLQRAITDPLGREEGILVENNDHNFILHMLPSGSGWKIAGTNNTFNTSVG